MANLRLLLVDDNADDRMLALRQLKQEFPQLQAIECNSYESLIEALKQEFDLAITDYQLRWSTGLEILKTLKQGQPHCPVIMFTGTGSEEVAVKAMKAGLDDYVTKSPTHFVQLASAVRSVWERKQQQQALEEAENRYRRLFEGAPIGLYRLTAEGRIFDANSTLMQMLGYTNRQDLMTGSVIERHLGIQYRCAWKEFMKFKGVVQGFETPLQRIDGSTIWVVHSARAIKNESGLVYYEGAIQDITERKQAERERADLLKREQEARAQAEAANRLKDEFLATLSHELRTPLNGIFGWVQLLRRDALGPEQKIRALEIIERNAKTQIQLVDDLLDVSRIIQGKMQLRLTPVNLNVVVQAALDTMRPAAEAKQISLHCNVTSSRELVSGDSERLQQIVWNLLVNAVKFTSEGGSVTVRVNYSQDKAQIVISDTGKGIAPQMLLYIFERFRQEDGSSTRAYGGLGLGLAIVRQLVDLHGGTVWADSAGEGEGATFTVELPLTLSRQASESPTQAVSQQPTLNGIRVLLVEDDADARELATFVLEESGANVTAVGSVPEALSAFEQQRPQILVSDISMPGEDGYDLIRQMRDHASNTELPAIALTAYAREEDRQQLLKAGFQMHLSKPIKPVQLVTAVTRLAINQSVD